MSIFIIYREVIVTNTVLYIILALLLVDAFVAAYRADVREAGFALTFGLLTAVLVGAV